MNYLGYSLTEQGHNLIRARQLLQKAAEERPNEGAIVDSLGWLLLRQGDIADALETLERAVELEPEDPVINGHLGDAYLAAGRILDAAYQWQRALTFHPTAEDKAVLESKLQKLAHQP
jgi:Flp pilus assembly protein TadD